MDDKNYSICLCQGNLFLSIGGVTKAEIDKMNELREKDPEGTWDKKELTLLMEARKELGLDT